MVTGSSPVGHTNMINDTTEFNSPTYGSYINRSVCIVEFKDIPDTHLDLFVDNQLHPRKYFSNISSKKLSDSKVEFFIPLKRDNPTLKIAYSDKAYKKFFEKIKGIRGIELLELEN